MSTSTKGKDAVFFKSTEGQYGPLYTADFDGVPYRVSFAKSGDLVVETPNDAKAPKQFVKPKENQYGKYYVAQMGSKRYFISERENSRGKYLMAKPAPERELPSGAKTERPAAYGTRKS